ncbi:hypothetical protein H9X75_00570 [Fusobacterium mortiferum]|uniref:major outer membrane protein FomA n=1 Tax=Fusobacterium mortiferum TaxID=850 RepID=UPI001959A57E|nr:hypothetical protein [Fusobacterium mortiferum]
MKRLALLLGSLLVVTAAASAKEVVPAPVVVEEAPVQIIEKEVIVYREKEQGFRPNGYVDLQYRYYDKTEDQKNLWNTNDESSRTQLKTKINMTENQTLEARIRDYNTLSQDSTYTTTDEGKEVLTSGTTETRLRYWYNHGNVGDSKVNLDSRLEYKNYDTTQYVEYQAQFDFAEYLFNNDFIKTDYFQIAPKYRYTWSDDNSSNYTNGVGLDIYSYYTLPAGFSAELNVYATENFYGQSKATADGKTAEDSFGVSVEAYLYNTTNLYTNGNYTVDLGFEGGFDSYNWSQEKILKNADLTSTDSNSTYSLYALPYVKVNYQATEFVNLYAAVGAEYRNWMITDRHAAQDWRWQPTAWAGFNVAF